jgi:4-hydroxythreonine-4-phosphate dehydrogenase
VVAIDLDTRWRAERGARRAVRRAFGSRAARSAPILFKKIDSTLRGHVAGELTAARRALGGSPPVLFAPAFPAQGRCVRDAHAFERGRAISADLRALLARAGLPAAHADLAMIRGRAPGEAIEAAFAAGARALVCDAETDADLEAIARAGMALGRRALFVGSAGLARALALCLPRVRGARCAAVRPRPVVVVMGSASRVSVRQARRLAHSALLGPKDLLLQLEWTRAPTPRDRPVARRLGRLVAQAAPRAHYVLTGGETARAVLGALGVREYRLLGEIEPGIPYGIAPGGALVCTKAGGFGERDTLIRCVARLKREMKRS